MPGDAKHLLHLCHSKLIIVFYLIAWDTVFKSYPFNHALSKRFTCCTEQSLMIKHLNCFSIISVLHGKRSHSIYDVCRITESVGIIKRKVCLQLLRSTCLPSDIKE